MLYYYCNKAIQSVISHRKKEFKMLHQTCRHSQKWLLAALIENFVTPVAEDAAVAVAELHLTQMYQKWYGPEAKSPAHDTLTSSVTLPDGSVFHLIKVTLPNDVLVKYIIAENQEQVEVEAPELPEGEVEDPEAEVVSTFEIKTVYSLYHYEVE